MNVQRESIRILLVEDDPDEYVIFRDLLSDIEGQPYAVKWVASPPEALEELRRGDYDICFLDYRLGSEDGLDWMPRLKSVPCPVPVVVLTGWGDRETDVRAMHAGAADYLEKDALSSGLLERTIRYSLERTKALKALEASGQRLRELSAKMITIREDEQKTIARELHDSVGASLAAVKLCIENAMGEAPAGRSRDQLEKASVILRDTIGKTRKLCMDLRPAVLEDLGLVVALKSLCREFDGSRQVQYTSQIEERDIPELLKLTIYRIVQEALHNVSKHSGAQEVRVRLEKTSGQLRVTVKDNGKGWDAAQRQQGESQGSNGGQGLVNMKERAELTGGSLTVFSQLGAGTTVCGQWCLDGCREQDDMGEPDDRINEFGQIRTGPTERGGYSEVTHTHRRAG